MSAGRLKPELADLAPKGERRMGANPHANGGMLLRDLRMPDFRDYAAACRPGASRHRRHARARALPARRGEAQRRAAQFPRLRPGRDAVQRAGGALRGDQPPVGRGDAAERRISGARPDASWRCSASTSARAGSRATSSPAGMGSSTATRRSSTSSTRCSTSTPSG